MRHRQRQFFVKKIQDAVKKYFFVPHLNTNLAEIVKRCVGGLVTNAKSEKMEQCLNDDKLLTTFRIDYVVNSLVPTSRKSITIIILVVVVAFSNAIYGYITYVNASFCCRKTQVHMYVYYKI